MIFNAIKICNNCGMNYRTSRNKRLLVEIALIELAQATEEGSGVRPKTALRPIFKATQTKVATTQPQTSRAPQQQIQATTVVMPPKTVSTTTPSQTPATGRSKPQTFSLRGGGITNSSVKKNETSPSLSQAQVQATTEVRPFSNHDLCHEWRYFLNQLPREHAATAGRLKNIEPKLVKEWTGHIVFESQPVANCFLEIKNQMLQFMRSRLRNAQIELTYEVEALAAPTRVKTPREHWAELQQKNRLIQKLQKQLGLEFN
jgi:DNA polymerase-3 subunit gamma/tau